MEQDSNQFSRDLQEDTVMTSSETAGSNVQTMINIHSFLQGLIDGEWFLLSQPGLSVSFQPVLSVQGHSTSDRPVSPKGTWTGIWGTWTGIMQLFWGAKRCTYTPERKNINITQTLLCIYLIKFTGLEWHFSHGMFFSTVGSFNNRKLEYLLIFLCDPKTTPSFPDYICVEFQIMDNFLN